MRELRNGTKIIGIDHGYGNCKTANTVTPTGLHKYSSEPIFKGNILEFGGYYYRFGEGHKEFVADKSLDEDFYIFTLMAIARELNHYGIQTANVHIAAGLPLTWVRVQRDKFKEYLMQNKTVNFKFNDKDYSISIEGCSIYPQGYPAIVADIRDFVGTNMVADIGNGTMNIMYINNKKPIESKCWTEKLGVNQCVIAAKNMIMDIYGVKIEDNIVEQFLRFGTADIADDYLICLKKAAVSYVAEIFETLKKYEYNSDLMRLYIIGGGGCVVNNFGNFNRARVKIIEDICATAKGFEQLAYLKLKEQENKNAKYS